MKYFIGRTMAYIVDCVLAFGTVMLIVQWAIFSQIRESIGITDTWFRSSINMELYVLITISIPVWFYFTYFDSERSKGSFGKRLFKLVVKDHAKQKLSLGKSFFRTILKLLPWEIAHIGIIFPSPLYFENEPDVRILTIAGLILFAVYAVSILVDKKNRSLYDRVIGTIVLKE
jgi:uncharacterized RDD family membrane protein YckC